MIKKERLNLLVAVWANCVSLQFFDSEQDANKARKLLSEEGHDWGLDFAETEVVDFPVDTVSYEEFEAKWKSDTKDGPP